MSYFSRSSENILLDEDLIEIEQIQACPEFVIYHQFLSQLHLPTLKWTYSAENKGFLTIALQNELIELDEVFFKSLDYSKLINPVQLYTYFLLQAFLGLNDRFRGIGLKSKSKGNFLFLNNSSVLGVGASEKFERNALSRWVFKRGKATEIKVAHDSFFVLLDEKFKDKLQISLTQYQSETSQNIDKSTLIDTVLDSDRMERLRKFSLTEIGMI